jgi:hypothetical protein
MLESEKIKRVILKRDGFFLSPKKTICAISKASAPLKALLHRTAKAKLTEGTAPRSDTFDTTAKVPI